MYTGPQEVSFILYLPPCMHVWFIPPSIFPPLFFLLWPVSHYWLCSLWLHATCCHFNNKNYIYMCIWAPFHAYECRQIRTIMHVCIYMHVWLPSILIWMQLSIMLSLIIWVHMLSQQLLLVEVCIDGCVNYWYGIIPMQSQSMSQLNSCLWLWTCWVSNINYVNCGHARWDRWWKWSTLQSGQHYRARSGSYHLG